MKFNVQYESLVLKHDKFAFNDKNQQVQELETGLAHDFDDDLLFDNDDDGGVETPLINPRN